ncbi:MAG: hypothetical protein K2O06_15095 [Acetatifactor sp.]|nr:hypothetical protein [Acetatifactor sp.]
MGLFTKEPVEKKAYWKALETALKKPSEKTFPALEAACGAWQDNWQGWLLMALCYDTASGVEFSPEKAAGYHAKVKTRENDVPWLRTFYAVYDSCGANHSTGEKKYFPRTLKVRNLGAAMVQNYYPEDKSVMTETQRRGDYVFWRGIFDHIDTGGLFKYSEEQFQVMTHRQPFYDYICAFDPYLARNEEAMKQNGAAIIKATNKVLSKNWEIGEVPLDYQDTYPYVLGFAMVMGCRPYKIQTTYQNPRIDGWIDMWKSANKGCPYAARLLAEMFPNEQFREEIAFAATKSYRSGVANEQDAIKELRNYLYRLVKRADDSYAMTLLEQLNAML